MSNTRQTILIVGASRGLGLGLAQAYLRDHWQVIATVRTPSAPVQALASQFPRTLTVCTLDIDDAQGAASLAIKLQDTALDILFVNAGIWLGPEDAVGTVSRADFAKIMLTNVYSPLQVIEALQGRVRDGGIIAAMSSDLGSVANNRSGGEEFYRASKAALNSLMKSRHAANGERWRHVCLSPGQVRTDMGGPNAPLSVEDSVSGLMRTLGALDSSRAIQFLNHQGREVAW